MTVFQKAYVKENQEASIVCTNCGRQKIFKTAGCMQGEICASIVCECGHAFLVTLERRKAYRKRVSLNGHYSLKGGTMSLGGMVVDDISRSGIGFRTYFTHDFKSGDVVQLDFALDNSASSKVTKNAVVRNVTEKFVGAEFCDNEFEKTLGFYLMP